MTCTIIPNTAFQQMLQLKKLEQEMAQAAREAALDAVTDRQRKQLPTIWINRTSDYSGVPFWDGHDRPCDTEPA